MLGRIITVGLLLVICYWYWSGPYQERTNPSYETLLKQNADNMRLCLRGGAYQEGATGFSSGISEESCAQKYNLYMHEGRWHSYDHKRPDE